MNAVRFYTDEHIALAVVAGLRRRGADVLTTQEAGMRGRDDPAQLALATAQGRVLVSQDDDYLRLHALGVAHSGIAYAPQQTSVSRLIQGLSLIYQILEAEDMQNHVEFL
jgi:hypothetical protein